LLTSTNKTDNENPFIKTLHSYTADGNYPATTTDARGNVATQIIDATTGTLTSASDPTGQTVNYTYDSSNRVIELETIDENGGIWLAKTYKNGYTPVFNTQQSKKLEQPIRSKGFELLGIEKK
jgi:YD repeat-containing protein